MKRSTLSLIMTIVFGMIGLFLGAMMNAEGYIANIVAIAVTGFFIIRAIEDRNTRD